MLGLNDPVMKPSPSTQQPTQPPDTKPAAEASQAPPPAVKTPPAPSEAQQLEDELELDLENMKMDDNIDTSVSIEGDTTVTSFDGIK